MALPPGPRSISTQPRERQRAKASPRRAIRSAVRAAGSRSRGAPRRRLAPSAHPGRAGDTAGDTHSVCPGSARYQTGGAAPQPAPTATTKTSAHFMDTSIAPDPAPRARETPARSLPGRRAGPRLLDPDHSPERRKRTLAGGGRAPVSRGPARRQLRVGGRLSLLFRPPRRRALARAAVGHHPGHPNQEGPRRAECSPLR
jgi:hypothetical protein